MPGDAPVFFMQSSHYDWKGPRQCANLQVLLWAEPGWPIQNWFCP